MIVAWMNYFSFSSYDLMIVLLLLLIFIIIIEMQPHTETQAGLEFIMQPRLVSSQ